jgi:hypothetical protein
MVCALLSVHAVCGLEVVKTGYQQEETLFDGYSVSFEFHLETILGNAQAEETIKRLVYNNLDTGDYIAYKSSEFIERYAPDSGIAYTETITVNYLSDLFAIFQYVSTVYYADTWYSEDIWGYYIVDLQEQKILALNDLTQRLPEDALKELIVSQNDINYDDLSTKVWPPDCLSFEEDGVLFAWRSYSEVLVLPQRPELGVKIDYEFMKPYVTDKGKELMQNISGR